VNVLLDTSAYSASHRGGKRIPGVMQEAETVAVPAIVLGELYSGFRQGSRYAENRALLARFLAKPSVRVLSITEALHYAEIDVYLRCRAPLTPGAPDARQRLLLPGGRRRRGRRFDVGAAAVAGRAGDFRSHLFRHPVRFLQVHHHGEHVPGHDLLVLVVLVHFAWNVAESALHAQTLAGAAHHLHEVVA